jgi:phage-related protein
MPNARPMPTISLGVSELRVKGEDGIFRVFYYTASPKASWSSTLSKKRRRERLLRIELARKRLKELLDA